MVLVVGQFLLHALCALNVCLPHYEAPEPLADSSRLELRSVETGDSHVDILEKPTVFGSFGGVEGIRMKTIKGRNLAAFMGIPYAQPPINQLRFEPPVPAQPWEGVKVADKPSESCIQMDATQFFNVYGKEDCLYLNVYTPKISGKEKLPVIVFIHGGAYYFGTGSEYGPSYLLDNDVILVTFNYRLGAFGFLSTGDSVSPGNNGMKDQAMALRWVKNNIAAFGGDDSKITLMGQSAGASSVNLHLMSDLSKDIPFAAIMHSGSAHQEWTIVKETVKNSKIIAQSMHCPTESREMIECLKSKNPYFIVKNTLNTFKELFYPSIPFGPVVEAPSPDAFLTQHPKDAYAQGNVRAIPIIAGIVENEGDLFTFQTVLYPGYLRAMNRKWFKIAPYMFDYENGSEDPNLTSAAIKNFYFGNNSISFYTRDRISKMLGDRWVVTGVHKAMQFHSSIAPTYGYHFTYKGKYSISKPLSLNRADWGVTHLDDISYFMNSTLYFEPLKIDDAEFLVSEFMTKVWSNFATTGKPSHTNDDGDNVNFWKPIKNPLDMNLIEINDKIREIKFPFLDRIKFWNDLGLSDDYSLPKELIGNHKAPESKTFENNYKSAQNIV